MRKTLARSDEALTPVLGTALLIAVLVALSITVFLMLRFYTEDGAEEPRPDFALQKDEQSDHLDLVVAEGQLEWGSFEIRAAEDNAANFALNGLANETSQALTTSYQQIDLSTVIQGGHFIDICGDTNGPAAGGGASQQDVRVLVRHVHSNKVVFDGTFTILQACA